MFLDKPYVNGLNLSQVEQKPDVHCFLSSFFRCVLLATASNIITFANINVLSGKLFSGMGANDVGMNRCETSKDT